MSNTDTIEIVKRIPKPPEGYVFENRPPRDDSQCFRYVDEEQRWSLCTNGHTWAGCEDAKYEIFAYRLPKKKRLMTPSELAGKWLHRKEDDVWHAATWMVWIIERNKVPNSDGFNFDTVENLHAQGVLWSDTPTSKPRSLEVDE